MKIPSLLSCFLTLLLALPVLRAELKLPAVVGDHMVLQRRQANPIWGWDSAGAKITVSFAGQTHTATAGADGRWTVNLTALEASAEPRTLRIAGSSTREIKDVLAYLRVLVSQKETGAGYRIISALDMGGRRVLLDRGFARADQPDISVHEGSETVDGNLQWPEEIDGFTPEPDHTGNIWFARDVAAMAQALGTEPILVVAKQTSFDDSPVTPLPVDTAAITNDHLSYAITWFSLAAIWVAMMDLSSCLVTR